MRKLEDKELDQQTNFKHQMKVALIVFGIVEFIVTVLVVVYMKRF